MELALSQAGVEVENEGRRALFDSDRLVKSAEHANTICQQYGVKILRHVTSSCFL